MDPESLKKSYTQEIKGKEALRIRCSFLIINALKAEEEMEPEQRSWDSYLLS